MTGKPFRKCCGWDMVGNHRVVTTDRMLHQVQNKFYQQLDTENTDYSNRNKLPASIIGHREQTPLVVFKQIEKCYTQQKWACKP